MRNDKLAVGIVLATLALGASTARSGPLDAVVSPGKTAAFANVLQGTWSISQPILEVQLLHGKRHYAVLAQANVGTSGGGSNADSFAALLYIEDATTGNFTLMPQTGTGQTCPEFSVGYCTLSTTGFFDLDDPANAAFVNKPLNIELFAYHFGGSETANATLAVQLVRK